MRPEDLPCADGALTVDDWIEAFASAGAEKLVNDVRAVRHVYTEQPEGDRSLLLVAILDVPGAVAVLTARCDAHGWGCDDGGDVSVFTFDSRSPRHSERIV